MNARVIAKPLALASTAASLLVVPMGPQSHSLLGVDDACASGTCCIENGSECIVDGLLRPDRYFKSEGPCATP